MEKKNTSVFSGVLDAIKRNRRPSDQDMVGNMKGYQTMPPIDPTQGPEQMQQTFLDWQVSRMSHDLYTRTVYFDTDRISAYQDFRAMDMTPEIAAALDIIRDECLTRGESGDILGIYSENERVKNVLNDLFKNVLNVEYNLRLWIRDLVKYGDYFVYFAIDKESGIYDFVTLPVEEVHREEGYDGTTNSVRFRWETTGDYFEEWQIAHFCMMEDSRKAPYGRSKLDAARKLWKQLQLAEDAMLVYRLTRAPERRVFYIEVGNLPDQDVKGYLSKVQNSLKRQPIVDQRGGNVSYKFNPHNVTEDYYIPIRGDKSSRIETLPGASNMSDIQDIEFLQNKLFASIQVPKTYLNYSESLPGGATLSQSDLRFSRTINSIQEVVLAELRRVANVHLYFSGFLDDIDNFKLSLTNPSTQQELLKLETMKARLEVFKEFFSAEVTSPASYIWAMENILGFSKSDIKLILKQKKVEKKMFAEIESAAETYKKIGLFKDIDAKFEDPEKAAQFAANGGAAGADGGTDGADAGGGGFGGSSPLGGLGGGGMDAGGTPGGAEAGGVPGGTEVGGVPGGVEAGGAPGGAEAGGAAPMQEIREQKRLKKLIQENFDLEIDSLIDELTHEEEVVKKSYLLENSVKKSLETKKLISKIEKNLNKIKVDLTPYPEKNENALLESNEKMIEKSKSIFDNIDKIIEEERNQNE